MRTILSILIVLPIVAQADGLNCQLNSYAGLGKISCIGAQGGALPDQLVSVEIPGGSSTELQMNIADVDSPDEVLGTYEVVNGNPPAEEVTTIAMSSPTDVLADASAILVSPLNDDLDNPIRLIRPVYYIRSTTVVGPNGDAYHRSFYRGGITGGAYRGGGCVWRNGGYYGPSGVACRR